MKIRICSIEDCGAHHYARGYCVAHYRAARRAAGCSIEECDRPHYALGLCATHTWRLKQHGDPHYVRPRRVCEVDGCDRKHSARGYCTMHYERSRAGTPLDAPLYAGRGSRSPVSALAAARANKNKARDAGQRHAAAAQALLATGNNHQVLQLRRAHPDASLRELAALCTPPMTKNAYASKLRRLLAKQD